MPVRLILSEAEREPLFAALICGGCGRPFSANARTVPCLKNAPACSRCWDRLNDLRTRANLLPWNRPACYPEDYPP